MSSSSTPAAATSSTSEMFLKDALCRFDTILKKCIFSQREKDGASSSSSSFSFPDSLQETFDGVVKRYEDTDFLSRADASTALSVSLGNTVHDIMTDFQSDVDKKDSIMASVAIFFDLAIACAQKNMCTADIPFKLLHCLLRAQTLEICSEVWNILEERTSVLSKPLFVGAEGKNSLSKLSLLQLSNGLLQRCSQLLDTRFSGRILLFLAKACPLSERSGVNVGGAFNEESAKSYETKDGTDRNIADADAAFVGGEDEADGMDVDGGTPSESESKAPVIMNYRLYRNFWKIQKYFSAPHTALESVGEWKSFLSALETTLSTFEGLPLATEEVKRTQNQCSKYLTQQSLLRLQINDPALRRSVLLQTLFTLQYLISEDSARIKRVLRSREKVSKINRAQEVQPLIRRSFDLLEKTGVDGSVFKASCKAILEREDFWIRWKEAKCASYTRPSAEKIEGGTIDKGMSRGVAMMLRKAKERYEKLEDLYQPTDNLTCLSDGTNFHIPTLDAHLEDYRDAEDPENGIEEQYHPKKNHMYCWRGLRLMTKNHLHVFDAQTQIIQFDDAVKKLDGVDDSSVLKDSASKLQSGSNGEEKKKEIEGTGEEKKQDASSEKGADDNEEVSDESQGPKKRQRRG